MSKVLKQKVLRVRNEKGEYEYVNSIGEKKTSEMIEEITNKGEQIKQEIINKGQQTKDSIPDDYSELDARVTSQSQQIVELQEQFEKPIQEQVDDYLNRHPEATTTVQDGSLTMNKIKIGELGYVTPEMFGAFGDGLTDDAEKIQDAYDYAHERGIALRLLAKTYAISKPIVIHSTKRNYNNNINKERVNGAALFGDSKGGSVLKKTTHDVDPIYEKDAVIVLTTTEEYQNGTNSNLTARYFTITNITIDCYENVDAGIFANSFYFADISNVILNNFGSGIMVATQSCYNRFISVECNFCDVGFNMGISDVSKHTTLLFEECHTNGCTVHGYSLNAHATLINCSQDGGSADFIKVYNVLKAYPNIKLINCHHESRNAKCFIDVTSAVVNVDGGYYLVPDVVSAWIKCDKISYIKVINACIDTLGSQSNVMYNSDKSSVEVVNCQCNYSKVFQYPKNYTKESKYLYLNGDRVIDRSNIIEYYPLGAINTDANTLVEIRMRGHMTGSGSSVDAKVSDTDVEGSGTTIQIGVSGAKSIVPISYNNYGNTDFENVHAIIDLSQYTGTKYIWLRLTDCHDIVVESIKLL